MNLASGTPSKSPANNRDQLPTPIAIPLPSSYPRRWPKEADETISGTLPDGTGTALPITQASLFVSGHNHLSIGEKRSYQFEGLTKQVNEKEKGSRFTMNLKKGPAALHTWLRGKDTILSEYYVYVTRKGDSK